jgi:hypothetical protein
VQARPGWLLQEAPGITVIGALSLRSRMMTKGSGTPAYHQTIWSTSQRCSESSDIILPPTLSLLRVQTWSFDDAGGFMSGFSPKAKIGRAIYEYTP